MRSASPFVQVLSGFPVPGTGRGSHAYLLTCANHARWERVTDEQAFTMIRAAIPAGLKTISDSEIWDAIEKAYEDGSTIVARQPREAKPARRPTPRKPDFATFIAGYEDGTEGDLIGRSPAEVIGDHRDALSILSIYDSKAFLFVGDRCDTEVRTVEEWVPILSRPGLPGYPLIIPNPLSGKPGLTKAGTLSMRCDATVADFRFAIAEFDGRPESEQVAFWLAAIDRGLPVAAVIHSGGKSIHGWLAVNCADQADWEASVEQRLFPEILVPMGCDPACRNESRLSRLPGHFREDKQRLQRLLYLNPEVRV